jgi:tetratricopeptide (TPR) repeat protein
MSYELGKLLIKKKEYNKAFMIFKDILKKNPNDLGANFQLGKINYELNDLNQSIFFFKKCNQIQSNTPSILFNLALSLQSIGKINEAKKQYLKLISINPNDVKSYYGLFFLDITNINSNYYNKLQSLINNNKISLFEKSLINFIFSKIEKKNGNLNNEINFLEISHQQCYNSNSTFNNQSDFYYKNIISNFFNKIKFEKNFIEVENFNKNEHIFIVGLPRSGSTLVETILSHNSKSIVSVGEFHGINTSILDQISKFIFSQNFKYTDYQLVIDRKIFQNSLIEKYNNFERSIYLDKSLENFFNIDIILEFFPNAKFIHTFRNYEDSILGIYLSMLPELSWSHNIKNIINYIKNYKRVINYYISKYPDKIIDVDLSKLTNNQESEGKKILEFCNIPVNDNFLNFYKNKKLFNKTNSFLQVRNKIMKYENEKYKHYYYLLKDSNEQKF